MTWSPRWSSFEAMSAWLEAFEGLPEAAKERVRRWVLLQRLVADTLGVPFERWVEEYVGGAMAHPFDYRFLDGLVPGGFEGFGGATEFSLGADPATAGMAKVPVRAANQLGRLSPGFQDAIRRLLDDPEAPAATPPPGDVATLQKIFPGVKALARLKRPEFRRLRLTRDHDALVLSLDGPAEDLAQLPLEEVASTLARRQT